MLYSFLKFVAPRHFSSSFTNYLSKMAQSTQGMASTHPKQQWQHLMGEFDSKQAEHYFSEKLIMVDDNDTVIGPISKGESHAIQTVRNNVYHRALSLLIFDEEDRFLLTQRASSKITFPEYFTNACCSHPLFNEKELEEDGNAIGVKRAVIRRSNYELGTALDDFKMEDLIFVNKLAYRAESDGGIWGEAEIDYIFILRKNLQLKPNPEEVKSYRYVTKSQMQDLLINHRKYEIKITPWVKLLSRDLLFTYWDNLCQLDRIAQPRSIICYKDLFPAV